MGNKGAAYRLLRPLRRTVVFGSVPAPGFLRLPPADNEPTQQFLLDSGAQVHVAGLGWESALKTTSGCGTNVTGVGGHKVRSVGQAPSP